MHPAPRPPFAMVLALGAAALLGPLPFATPSAPAAEPGLIAHWEFASHRTQGTSIKAAHGGPNLTPSGAYRFADDPPPARIELSGLDEQILVAPSPDRVPLPRQALTVETWVRPDPDPVSPRAGLFAIAHGIGPDWRGVLLAVHDDRFTWAVSTEAVPAPEPLISDQPLQPGHWHHVVGTCDGQTQRLFVNGRPVAQRSHPPGQILYPTEGPILIGSLAEGSARHRLRGALNEVRVFQRALAPDEIAQRHSRRRPEFPAPAPLPIHLAPSYGPFIDWVDRTTVLVTWETDVPMPSRLECTPAAGGPTRVVEQSAPTRRHAITLDHLPRNTEFFLRLVGPAQSGRPLLSRRYDFDSSFHYAPAAVPPQASTVAASDSRHEDLARDLLARAGVRQGWCLILGARDGRLALEIVRQSDFKVLVVEPDPARVQACRRLLDQAGVHGVRASVQQLPAGGELPYGAFLANLVVSESALHTATPPPWSAAEVHRLLRPTGGVLLLGTPATGFASDPKPEPWSAWLSGSELAAARLDTRDGLWVRYQRQPLPGAGDWSHQYGAADNTSSSLDEHVKGDLLVSWWGDPGPRPMPDRGPRNPAPLSVNGRLYIQGDRVLFGLDAYNGAVLWTVAAPEVRRANVPRDGSNMAADARRLYVAHSRYCLAFDGQTGVRAQRYELPSAPSAPPADWGFLSVHDRLLIGSRVKPESRYLGDDGEWFEDDHAGQISRVTSETLFGLNLEDGSPRWTYRGGAILNSTLTVGDDMIFFIESRNPEAMAAPTGRIAPELLTDQHLVALDLRSGRTLWSKAHDFSELHFMTYLVYSRNTLVATGTDRNKHFHTYAFHAPSPASPPGDVDPLAAGGQRLWSRSHKEDKGHHSGHLQHPVVVDGVFYSDQRSFDLATGETLRTDLPERRGCGTMSAGRHALFFRHHFHGMWDLASDRRSQFQGIRGGCWLGLIPAGGMLLAPESSAGCSCTHAIQTSVGYLPRDLARR